MSFNANGNRSVKAPISVKDSDSDYVLEDANGAISFSAAKMTVASGLFALAFADGNTVQISGLVSGTNGSAITATNQANQLVSAMASFSAGSGGVSSTFTAQTSNESQLFASAQH